MAAIARRPRDEAAEAERELEAAMREYRSWEADGARVTERRSAAIHAARDAGPPRRHIQAITGLSDARIDQILRGTRGARAD